MLCNTGIHGIDFSGASDAGNKIWIASGTVIGGSLQIDSCKRCSELPNSGKERRASLRALCQFIITSSDGIFGLDFPFGLPEIVARKLLSTSSWEEFIAEFPGPYSTPEHFRESCFKLTGRRELKRDTDRACKAPFSPYNLRLNNQTYFGIRDVLKPLVGCFASAQPMQQAFSHKAQLIEICPASTLKVLGLHQSYKGRSSTHRRAKHEILATLKRNHPITFAASYLEQRAVDDTEGDALDSIIAAYAVFKNIPCPTPSSGSAWELEGLIYS